MAKQLNVFAQNQPGRLKKVTRVLFQENINIRAIEIQDRGDYGIIKLLVDSPDKALLALTNEGLPTAIKEVVAIEMDDQPGGLFRLMAVIDSNDINVSDAYGFVIDAGTKAVWCVEADDTSSLCSVLHEAGFVIVADSDLYEL